MVCLRPGAAGLAGGVSEAEGGGVPGGGAPAGGGGAEADGGEGEPEEGGVRAFHSRDHLEQSPRHAYG